jgi:hypothetical protein
MLEDHVVLESAGLFNDCSIHCMLSDLPPNMPTAPSTSDDIESGNGSDGAQRTSRRGFDSLISHGFSVADVDTLRGRFQLEIDVTENMLPVIEGESAADRRYRSEEAWQQSQSQSHSLLLTRENEPVAGEGNYNDFLWGLIMTLLLGVLMVFFVADRSVTKRQKLGIIVGFILNSFLEIYFKGNQHTQSGGSSADVRQGFRDGFP